MARFVLPAWMVIAVLALCCSAPSLDAQSRRRPPAKYLGGHEPDQAEGARILEDMRNIVLMGTYFQEFELRVLPRKGAEKRVPGRAFGSLNEQGPVMRIELLADLAAPEVLLVQNGPEPAVWRMTGEAGIAVAGGDVVQPLAGTTLSAADLQIPFMYWTEFVYEGRTDFRGRPNYIFLLFPPETEAVAYPGIGGARVFIDTQYRAPLQVQWVDDAGQVLKTISILDLKKVDERWIVKSFEVRDERSRDKTRFLVKTVAFDNALPPEWFKPTGPGGLVPQELTPSQPRPVR